MTSGEASQIEIRKNIHIFPDLHAPIQNALMEFADTMSNDPRSIREVELKSARIETELPNDFAYMIGSQVAPQFVDLYYGYSPVDAHVSPDIDEKGPITKPKKPQDVLDFAMKLHGDRRTGESVDIVSSGQRYRKQHNEGYPLLMTPSDNMNVLDNNELKAVLAALLPYAPDMEKVLHPTTRLLDMSRGVFSALIVKSQEAFEQTSVLLSDPTTQLLVGKRTYYRKDNEPSNTRVYSVEAHTTQDYEVVPDSLITVPVTRKLSYRFSQSSLTASRNQSALMTHICAGNPKNTYESIWLNNISVKEQEFYYHNQNEAPDRFLAVIRTIADSDQTERQSA